MFSSYKPWNTKPELVTIEDALNAVIDCGKKYFKFGIVEISEDEAVRFIKDYLSCNDHLGNPKDLDVLNTEVETKWVSGEESNTMHHIATMHVDKTREGNVVKAVILSTCKCMYEIDYFQYLGEDGYTIDVEAAKARSYRSLNRLNVLPEYKPRYQKREWR